MGLADPFNNTPPTAITPPNNAPFNHTAAATSPISGKKVTARAAATTNINIAAFTPGLSQIDEVGILTGDLVLLTAQTIPSQNGLYRADVETLERAFEADEPEDFARGLAVSIFAGTYANQTFVLNTTGPIIVGTTALRFELAQSTPKTPANAAAFDNSSALIARKDPGRMLTARVGYDGALDIATWTIATPIDDTMLVNGDYVLLWSNNPPTDAGLFIVRNNMLARAPEADSAEELNKGLAVRVLEGGFVGMFYLVTPPPIVLGTTPLLFDAVMPPQPRPV